MNMKKCLTLFILILAVGIAKAQSNGSPPDTSKNIPVYTVSEASYPGGIGRFRQYIDLMVKKLAPDRFGSEQGVVQVGFIVQKDGALSDIEIVKGLSDETNAQALKIIKGSVKWRPALQNSQPVVQKMSINIPFNL